MPHLHHERKIGKDRQAFDWQKRILSTVRKRTFLIGQFVECIDEQEQYLYIAPANQFFCTTLVSTFVHQLQALRHKRSFQRLSTSVSYKLHGFCLRLTLLPTCWTKKTKLEHTNFMNHLARSNHSRRILQLEL